MPKCVYIFRWERAAEIKQALAEGRCVVADRYSYSGIVYTASKEHPQAAEWEWCLRSEEGLPQPDLVLCLLPENADDLASRGGYGDERFDNAPFQTRVASNYRRLADCVNSKRQEALSKGQKAPLWEWVIVGKMTIEEVQKIIFRKVQDQAPAMPPPRHA